MKPEPKFKKYEIIDDSGVDYNFLGPEAVSRGSWKGQIVNGNEAPGLYEGAIVIEKPFGLTGVWISDTKSLREIEP